MLAATYVVFKILHYKRRIHGGRAIAPLNNYHVHQIVFILVPVGIFLFISSKPVVSSTQKVAGVYVHSLHVFAI